MLTHTLLRNSLFFSILLLHYTSGMIVAADDEQKVLLDIKSTVVKIEFQDNIGSEFQKNFGPGAKIQGMMSGVVIGSEGKILIGKSLEKGTIKVHFNDGREVQAQIVKNDKELGLTILKVDLINLKSAVIAKEIPPVGEKVIVAGYIGKMMNESFETLPGKLTSNKYEPQSLPKSIYGYYITADVAIKQSINILFTEKGELLSVMGMFNVETGTPPSMFYPLQSIPTKELEAFIK